VVWRGKTVGDRRANRMVVLSKPLEPRDDYTRATRYSMAPYPLKDLLAEGYENFGPYLVPTTEDAEAGISKGDWAKLVLVCAVVADGHAQDPRFAAGWKAMSHELPFVFVSGEKCACESLCYWLHYAGGEPVERVELRCSDGGDCEERNPLCSKLGPLSFTEDAQPPAFIDSLRALHNQARLALGEPVTSGDEEDAPHIVVPVLRLSSFLDLLRVQEFWAEHREMANRALEMADKAAGGGS
jgi:hypothetical protein